MRRSSGLPVISGDGHLEIDPKMWRHRVPAEYVDQMPRVVVLPDGGEGWQTGDTPPSRHPKGVYGGRDDWTPLNANHATTPGTGRAEQRLAELDQDGVDAEVLFFGGSGPGGIRRIADDRAYLSVLRAYNEFLARDYCSVDPRRLMGAGYVPISSVADAVREITWMKNNGIALALLSRFPNGTAIPRTIDDEFWAAAVDLEMPIAFHTQIPVEGSEYMEYLNADRDLLAGLVKATEFVKECGHAARPAGINALQLILSGVFDRFPSLRIFGAETGIGWIPWFIEDADHRYKRHYKWVSELLGVPPLKSGLPSEYVRRHFCWGFQGETTGILLRETIGVDNLIWASDFPHLESDWPHSVEQLEKMLASVGEEDFDKMTCLNITRFLGTEENVMSLSQDR